MKQTAKLIQKKIDQLIAKEGRATVMLTGGRAAAQLYSEWKHLGRFKEITDVTFYFGDERCVEPNHPESNYGMTMKTLFSSGIPNNCVVHRMKAESKNLEYAASQYAELLPESIDILLLGVGEDGHIASMFPHSSILHEKKELCLPVKVTKLPYGRLTVTPLVIKKSKLTLVLALGDEKVGVMHKVQNSEVDVDVLPAKLVKKAIWRIN